MDWAKKVQLNCSNDRIIRPKQDCAILKNANKCSVHKRFNNLDAVFDHAEFQIVGFQGSMIPDILLLNLDILSYDEQSEHL